MRYAHEIGAHSVTLGTVNEETIRNAQVKKALEPKSHIFICQRAWWCKGLGTDDLRQVDRFGGDFEGAIKRWEKANL